MRSMVRWSLVLLVLLAAVPATAGKIGFLDVEKAVSTVQQGQVQMKALDDWAKPRQEQLDQLRARAVELANQLAAQRSVASADAVAQLEKDAIQARRSFEDAGRTFQRDLDTKQNELLGDVALRLGQVASEYGKANDFDAIFTLQAQPLIYIADAANLTDTVIRIFDERYPVK
jgi:outer membrane protein